MKQMAPGRRKAIAYHEPGHIVAALDQRVQVRDATIVPNEDYLGQVAHHSIFGRVRPDRARSQRASRRIEQSIIVSMAGPAAQRLYCKRNRARSWPLHGGDSIIRRPLTSRATCAVQMKRLKPILIGLRSRPTTSSQCSGSSLRSSRALLEHSTLSAAQIRDMADRSR